MPYFDVTFSPSKSITLLHASFMANMSAALDRGSLQDAGYWAAAADDAWDCVSAGSQAMLGYLQEHAGYTRSGYHGTSASGVSSGRTGQGPWSQPGPPHISGAMNSQNWFPSGAAKR